MTGFESRMIFARFPGSYPKKLQGRFLRMTNKLKEYFPMIRTREAIMEKIEADRHMKKLWNGLRSWKGLLLKR